MLIGITIDKFDHLKIKDVLNITNKLGLQYVEITESILDEDVFKLSKFLKTTRTGFHLPNTSDNGYDFSCSSHQDRIDILIKYVNRYKNKLNIDYCITHPPECEPENSTQADVINILFKNLNQLDCPLVIENIASLNKQEFDDFYALARESLQDKVLGVCFDAPHSFISGENPVDMIDHLNGSIYSVHLSDCKRRRDLHLPFGLGGELPLDSILSELKKIKFNGNINLELMPRSINDINAVIDSYMKVLRKFKKKKYLYTKIKLILFSPLLKKYLNGK